MKKRLIPAVLCTAAMLLLTGCGTGQNPSVHYKDYFSYCFGEDYTFTPAGVTDDDGKSVRHKVFRLEYRDANGNLRVNEKVDCFPYPKENKLLFPTKKDFYDSEVADIAFSEIEQIVSEAFRSDFFSQYFSFREKDENTVTFETEDGNAEGSFVFMMPVNPETSEERVRTAARRFIEPGTGLQACTADLRSVLADDRWELICTLTVNAAADAEPYVHQMQKMVQALTEYAETPQNWSFFVRQYRYDDGKNFSTDTLFQTHKVMGEAVDIDAKRAEDGEYSVARDCREKIIEKYGNT